MTRTPGLRAWAALAVLTLAVTLLAIDSTVLALAIPSLSADLSPTASQLLWIGDIYSFTLAGLLVTMGNVADRIGRRRLLLIGTFGFGTASIMAAFAPSAGALIAARALLASRATIMPSTLSLIRNVFPDARHRTTAIAIWSAGSSGGTALGPLVGGVLLERFWWGSVFLINVPVMAAVIVTGSVAPAGVQERSGSPGGPGLRGPVGPGHRADHLRRQVLRARRSHCRCDRGTGGRFGCRLAVHQASAHAGHAADRRRALPAARIHLGHRGHRPGDLRVGRPAVLLLPVPPARPGLLHTPSRLD